MTTVFVRVHTLLLARRGHRGDRGQTTAEYALVLLGVAAIALLVVAWAKSCCQTLSQPPPGRHRSTNAATSSAKRDGSSHRGVCPMPWYTIEVVSGMRTASISCMS